MKNWLSAYKTRNISEIGWTTLTIISRMINLGSSLFADPNIIDLFHMKRP